MNIERDRLTPEEARAREALRGLGTPAADPKFREGLAREFAAGTIPAPRVVGGPEWFRRPVAWASMAAAAAVLMIVAGWMNRGPEWRVVDAKGSGSATVGYRSSVVTRVPDRIALTDRSALERALAHGMSIAVQDSAELTLVADGALAFRLTPGTSITLPRPPNRWFGRRRAVDVVSGELFVSTGQDFKGAGLEVRTPEATVVVTGTTFAVLAHEHGTCVCVMEGVVRVTPKGGPAEDVPPGRRCFIYNDGSPEDHDKILPESEAGLSELVRTTREQLRR